MRCFGARAKGVPGNGGTRRSCGCCNPGGLGHRRCASRPSSRAQRPSLARLCLSAFLLLSRAGNAQATNQPTEKHSQARAAFESGVAAFEAQNFEAARAAFERALSLKPSSSSIRRNLGIAEVYAGHYARGAQRLTRFLRAERDLDETARARIAQTLAISTQHLERVSLLSSEPEVVVYVDGQLVGKTPIAGAWYVAPGPFVVSAEKQGFRPLSEQHNAQPGATRTLMLEMVPRSVSERAARPEQSPAQFAPQRRSNAWAYGLFAASGVGLSAGSWALLRGNSLQRDANSAYARACSGAVDGDESECSQVAALDRRAANRRTAAAVGFAVSGAALVGGVLLYSSETGTQGGSPSEQSLRLRLSPTGLALKATF